MEERISQEQQDRDLLSESKAGNLDSFGKLIEKYNQKLFYTAYNMVFNKQDAEDLSQTAFVKAWQNLDNFREDSSFQTWLIQILLNLCRSHLRHRNIVTKFVLPFSEIKDTGEETETQVRASIPDKSTDGNPEDKMYLEHLGEILDKAISELPRREKEVFSLKHLNEMKISEISDILKIAEGSVKAHIFKAVKKLQKRLKHYHEM